MGSIGGGKGESEYAIASGILRNSGFIRLYQLVVEEVDIDLSSSIICDAYLDTEPALLRRVYGYGKPDTKWGGQLQRLSRLVARDPVMSNLVTAEQVLSFMGQFGLDANIELSSLVCLLIGYGFESHLAVAIGDELRTLSI